MCIVTEKLIPAEVDPDLWLCLKFLFDEAQAGIKIARRNINNLRYADDTTIMAESEEEPLDENEKGEWKKLA